MIGGYPVAELAIREAVRDTITTYAVAGDRARLDELAACFVPDGVLEVDGEWSATGRDEIVARLSGNRERRPAAGQPGFFIRHFVTNIHFEAVSETEARVASYFSVLTATGLDHWGRYRDLLVPHDGRWRFTHRRVRIDAHSDRSWLG